MYSGLNINISLVTMSNAKELRDLTIEELEANSSDLYKELYELRNQIRGSGTRAEKPHLIQDKKRELARHLTLISEKKQVAQAKG